jgi:hypothetical protein
MYDVRYCRHGNAYRAHLQQREGRETLGGWSELSYISKATHGAADREIVLDMGFRCSIIEFCTRSIDI